jgi:cell division protein ZapA (FtsZ GTPase activity inhibitor)
MAKTIEVQVLGRHFVFNIPEDFKPEEFLEIIYYVETKIKKIKTDTIDLDSFKLGLLTSINIAEELFSLKRENESLKVILNRIDQIISPLEENLIRPESWTSSKGKNSEVRSSP